MNKSPSVLLIDHDTDDNFIHQKLFESIGIDNVIVIEKSIEAIVQIHNSDVIPNYIFINTHIPIINGFNIVRKLKKFNISFNDTSIIFLSNFLDPNDKIKADRLNIKIINKPLTIDKIKECNLLLKLINK